MTMIDLSRRDLFTIGGALGVTLVSKPTTPRAPWSASTAI